MRASEVFDRDGRFLGLMDKHGANDIIDLLEQFRADIRVINGELLIEEKGESIPEVWIVEIMRWKEILKPYVIRYQQERQDMGVTDYNKPIRIFYANLLHHGITLRVVNGQLKVGGNTKSLSPIYRDEIVKRAEHLIELLEPEIPAELEPFFYRLLKVDELKEAIRIAEVLGISLRTTPVNGGWLVEIMNMRVKKEKV